MSFNIKNHNKLVKSESMFLSFKGQQSFCFVFPYWSALNSERLPFSSLSKNKKKKKLVSCQVCMCWVIQSSLTFCDPRLFCPWEFSRHEYWSGWPWLPPGDLPNPGIEPRSPTLQADSLLSKLPGSPCLVKVVTYILCYLY